MVMRFDVLYMHHKMRNAECRMIAWSACTVRYVMSNHSLCLHLHVSHVRVWFVCVVYIRRFDVLMYATLSVAMLFCVHMFLHIIISVMCNEMRNAQCRAISLSGCVVCIVVSRNAAYV